MSRGGRGGGGAGGGAAGREGLARRLGLDDPAIHNLMDGKPSDTFPKIDPPIARPPDHGERASVHHYRTLRARIHDGPFYCILDPSARVSKSTRRGGGDGARPLPTTSLFNAFDGQPTYAERFKKQLNTLPNLHKRPFVHEHFPAELWSTLGVGVGGDERKKTLQLSRVVHIDKWAEQQAGEDGEDGDKDGVDEEDDKEDKPDGENEDNKDDEDDENADPDQFDEDDEDDDDDYNAEQYFDDGDDDVGYDDGGGGGDDGDY